MQVLISKFDKKIKALQGFSDFFGFGSVKLPSGDYSVKLSLNDEVSDLLKMELMAPTQKHAYRLANAFSENAESIYRMIMEQLLSEKKEDA